MSKTIPEQVMNKHIKFGKGHMSGKGQIHRHYLIQLHRSYQLRFDNMCQRFMEKVCRSLAKSEKRDFKPT